MMRQQLCKAQDCPRATSLARSEMASPASDLRCWGESITSSDGSSCTPGFISGKCAARRRARFTHALSASD